MPGQVTRTDRIRNYLNAHIPPLKPETKIYTDSIVTALTVNRRNIMDKEVGMILRERTDVENVGHGVWRKK